ncbi:hypothetical protein [Nannocystis pusilla]
MYDSPRPAHCELASQPFSRILQTLAAQYIGLLSSKNAAQSASS